MNHFLNWGLFLMAALSLGFRPMLALVGLAFCVLGLARLQALTKQPTGFWRMYKPDWPVLVALLVLAVSMIGLNLLHGERWGIYHLPVAILISVPIFFALSTSDTNPRFLWVGASTGAVIAAAIAVYEVVFLGVERAGHFVHNPIPFGSVSMCLAAASVIGYQANSKACSLGSAWALAGMFAGVGAAVLSGSKGCLLALPVLAYVVHIKCIRPLGISRSWLWLGGVLTLAALAWLADDSFLTLRIEDGIRGAAVWFETGHVVDGSVGPRLELIRFAFDAAMVNPLTGIGRDEMLRMLQASATNGAYDPFIAQLHTVHNEFLNIWVTKGLLGLVAMGAVYGLSLWYFWRIRHHADTHVQNIGLMGMSLCLMYLIFGLSEVALQLTFFRNFFLVTLVCLLGMAHHQLHRTRKSSD
jgi:O-antigen ligase